MARATNVLSARKVATLTEPGRHADGGGLYLVVDPSGAKRWAFIFRFGGKRREMGLGGVLSVPLVEAREMAAAARLSIAKGLDPIEAGKAAPTLAPTFKEAAEQYIRDRSPSWRNVVHRKQWDQTIRDHAKHLLPIRVDAVTAEDVLKCLRPLWAKKPETASRLRGRIERILDAAKAANQRQGDNPARWRGHLEMILPKPRKLIRGHHASMPFKELPVFIADLRKRKATAACMMELVIFTVARSGEVRHMRQKDVKGAVWTIPAAQMKANRPHRVPLAPRAVAILAPFLTGEPDALVFPNRYGRPHTDMVFTALLRRMKVAGVTTHGFRASFKDWASDDTDHARETIEAALAHVIGDKAEQAYRRSDAIEKRRRLLHDWAAFLEGTGGIEAT